MLDSANTRVKRKNLWKNLAKVILSLEITRFVILSKLSGPGNISQAGNKY